MKKIIINTARLRILICFCTITFMLSGQSINGSYTGTEYKELKEKVATGWNTWNTKSVLSHVLLPYSFALNIELYDAASCKTLENALMARQGSQNELIEKLSAGQRTYDGSYTDLTIQWGSIKVRVESASEGNSFYLLISPLCVNNNSFVKLKPSFLWSKPGVVSIENSVITGQSGKKHIKIYSLGNILQSGNDTCIKFSLAQKIALSTNRIAKLKDVEQKIFYAREIQENEKLKLKEYSDIYDPMQGVLAWNTIYEPTGNRVISVVSQVWSDMWGGFMMPVWDTYLASYMLSIDNKELAYSNALAVTKSITKNGFIPNIATGLGKSEDRSQPPIGSFVIKEIYKKYKEKWLLYEAFDNLLSWNRWWDKNRNYDGFLCWGSNPYPGYETNNLLSYGVNERQGALYESGLDNSSMYDDIPFDKTTHLLPIADVGLMSLYVLDCNALAEIASEIEKPEIAKELKMRAEIFSKNLQKLWNNETGLFLNKRLDTNNFSLRLSPTLFYPLLAGVATPKQAERMIKEHFYNPQEFWGDYIMPSTPRNDIAFKDNHYFRGRIWGPMNFLVYLGLRKYKIGNSEVDMVEKSKDILLKSWNLKKDVYENYSADTGEGFDVGSSQKSYHWGALLGFMSLIENGMIIAPEKSINNTK